MRVMITGGTGFLGTELARRLLSTGDEVVLFDVAPNRDRVADISGDVILAAGNLAYSSEVFNAVKDNKVERVFHLGSMLSIPSNANPWAAFQANVVGTMNVLEAARLFEVEQVIFSSTLATYGIGTERRVDDFSLQRPTTMYGSCKLYAECLGRFYRNRFGLDFRGLRFPSIVGPGAKVKHVSQYYAWMIEYAALGRPFECFVSEETKGPAMYFKDAVYALDLASKAPYERIQTINYNVSGISPTPSAKELEIAVREAVPETCVSYVPEEPIMDFYKTMRIEVFDDTCARREWDWQPLYADLATVIEDFMIELRERPTKYGL